MGNLGKELFRAGAHGLAGGMFSVLQGGKFEHGFAAGFVSSLISSGVQGLGNLGKEVMVLDDLPEGQVTLTSTFGTRNKTIMDALTISAGGLSGGISSAIAGGKFWDGARQGLIVAGLNHAMHSATNNKKTLTREDLYKISEAYPSGNESSPDYVHRDKLYEKIGGYIYEDYKQNAYNSEGKLGLIDIF